VPYPIERLPVAVRGRAAAAASKQAPASDVIDWALGLRPSFGARRRRQRLASAVAHTAPCPRGSLHGHNATRTPWRVLQVSTGSQPAPVP
jgi:hypothetical protein